MDIDKYKKALSYMQDEGLNVVNRLALVYTDGEIKHIASTNCTASLGVGSADRQLECILSCVGYGVENEEYYNPFINWLVKRSPYADAFLSKQASKVGEDKCLIVNPDCPSNIMVGGIIAARGTYENTGIAKSWCELTKRGVNENLAFILSHWAKYGMAGVVGFQGHTQSHHAVDGNYATKCYIKAFINNKPYRINPTYQSVRRYSCIQSTWGAVDREYYLQQIFDKISYTKEKTNNVFACALPNLGGKTTTIDNGFNQLAALATEIMEDI
tara:strand:+ start:25705 stop:26517 length:813 start_codon:yes stop_codon:yes gene_type:complete